MDGAAGTSRRRPKPYPSVTVGHSSMTRAGWARRCVWAAASAALIMPALSGSPARAASGAGYVLARFAGTGAAGFGGDGGPALSAMLAGPRSVAVDHAGNVFVADSDNNRIRRVDGSGAITTVVGTGVAGFSGDSGPAVDAQIHRPFAIAIDKSGNLWLADSDNQRIRKVDAAGTISTVAGTGVAGFNGDGQASAAQLSNPRGLAVDPAGNVLVADTTNNRIRRITAAGQISTIAGTGVAGFAGDGGPATAAELNFPRSISFLPDGSLVFADTTNERVRRISTSGVITTLAGTGGTGFSGDGGAATAAVLNTPYAVLAGPAGEVYIADSENARIRRVDPSGVIDTIAGTGAESFFGDGGAARKGALDYPIGLASDGAGRILIAERDNNLVRVLLPAGPPLRPNGSVVGMARTPTGHGYWLTGSDGGVFSYGDAHFFGSTGAMHLNQPVVGIAATPTGNGYWLVASDGGVFSYGDAHFFGSTGAMRLARPIVGMASTGSGHGYWLVASDGGVFSYGDARFFGSAAVVQAGPPIVGVAASPNGDGYWLPSVDGAAVYSFGAAPFLGSLAASG